MPASSTSSPSRSAESGVSSAGFSTTVFPHASAGPSFHEAMLSGKFHGDDQADDAERLAEGHVDAARDRDRLAVVLVDRAGVEVEDLRDHRRPRRARPRSACRRSRDSIRASSSACSSTSVATRRRRRARSAGVTARQAGNAAFARATATSVSSTPACSSSAIGSSVAGFSTVSMALFEHDVRSGGWSPRRSQDVSGRGRGRGSRSSAEESRTATSRSRSAEETFVLRIGGKDTTLLGIDRRPRARGVDRRRRTSASGPTSSASSSPRATSSRGSCPATPVPADELRQPARLRRLRPDAAPHPRRAADRGALRLVPGRRELLRDRDRPRRRRARPRTRRRGASRTRSSAPGAGRRSATCHNDLLNANLIATEDGLVIVDWEYAGMGDRFFDLANFAANHDLTDDESSELLRGYFGELRPDDERSLAADALHVRLPRGDVGRRAAGHLGARRRLRRATRTSTSSGSPAPAPAPAFQAALRR